MTKSEIRTKKATDILCRWLKWERERENRDYTSHKVDGLTSVPSARKNDR